MKQTKAKAAPGSSAAALVGLITLVILFYILFLPPQERAELLGDSPKQSPAQNQPSPPDIKDQKGIILSEHPGSLIAPEKLEPKQLPNVFIAESVQSQTLAELPPVYVKNGVFDTKQSTKDVTFSLADTENIESVLFSFSAPRRKGMLTIYLNQEKIHEYVITKENPEPITIDPGLLQQKNTLTFSVDDVGYKFWKTNEYGLENIKLIGEVRDTSQQESRNIFVLTAAELGSIDQATLRFIPYCSSVRAIGSLDVLVNNKPVFSAVPVCDEPYFVPLSASKLKEGENTVTFATTRGRYSIEQIQVDFKEKEIKSHIYYFEMDPALFLGNEVVVSKAPCGVIDGICPEFCDEDVDKDCCFLESKDNYWCDVEPDDADDRCVSAISQAKCSRCVSGYEDKKGKPATACKEQCGDDTDDECPAGCDFNFDQDCCFADNADNYWCKDAPITGSSSTCERALTSGECDDCPFGYVTDSGGKADCSTGLEPIAVEEEDVLRPELNAVLYIDFPDDNRNKDLDIVVNGRRFNIDQDRPYFSRDISDWARSDNNYIELFPVTPINIVRLEIRIE